MCELERSGCLVCEDDHFGSAELLLHDGRSRGHCRGRMIVCGQGASAVAQGGSVNNQRGVFSTAAIRREGASDREIHRAHQAQSAGRSCPLPRDDVPAPVARGDGSDGRRADLDSARRAFSSAPCLFALVPEPSP